MYVILYTTTKLGLTNTMYIKTIHPMKLLHLQVGNESGATEESPHSNGTSLVSSTTGA